MPQVHFNTRVHVLGRIKVLSIREAFSQGTGFDQEVKSLMFYGTPSPVGGDDLPTSIGGYNRSMSNILPASVDKLNQLSTVR